jgi:hypothetical protein
MIHHIKKERKIMVHLLHIDSSITGEQSTSRRVELINEIKQAETVVLGLPLQLRSAKHDQGMGRHRIHRLAARGGGYGPGTRGKAGITLSRGSHTHCQRPASNRGSSPPN